MVSLIFTVLNEAHSLPELLDSIAAQTRMPDEVVICDGGSRDGTLALLQAERRFPLRIIEAPGANISRGRNLAIAAAMHDLITCSDAGVCLHPEWLARIVQPLEAGAHSLVAGFFLPKFRTPFEMAMSATVLPALEDISATTFLPSSRSVAFHKSTWQAAGGYPEWIDYCEDLLFDFAARDACGPFTFVPDAIVYFRPRGSLRSFYKQYYLYARGDGKANLWLRRHLIRYATYIAFPLLLAVIMAVAAPWNALAALVLLLGAAAYLRTPYRQLTRLWQSASTAEKLRAALWPPVIRVAGDIAKMAGYPVGLAWRRRRCSAHAAAPDETGQSPAEKT
ncbi:MAG: glycosyltransferase [Chloroflexi bacterium]|nr:glycosyltransferase [Chloroflexota bacterium]